MTPTEAVARAIARAVRPDPKVRVDEWAEANRVLPEDTPEPGPYRNRRTPYLIDIQRTMSPGSPTREGWFKKPHQIGGSVSGENMVGAWICTAAGSMLVVFPTLEDANQWELARFEPMRASTKELRRRIRPAHEKGSDNTKRRKKYPGGVMRLVGANRVGALKSSTIRYVKFEEPDEYGASIGDQGHPIALALKRITNFGRKAKAYGDGTPTVDGASAIHTNFLRGDQRRWYLHCPECKHPQHLQWQNLKWVDGDPATAQLACTECGALNAEHIWKGANYAPRTKAMSEADAKAAGRAYWEATAIGEPGVASWHLNALAAPIGWRPWPELVAEWIAAQGDEEKLKVFVNNVLAECYSHSVRATTSAEKLHKRAEQYDLMTCPHGGLVCTAGIDTQDNRLAVVIRAWGRSEQSWGLHHGEIFGTPSSPETWAKLRELLEAPIRHANGQVMHVDAAAIDAGGHHAEDVYAFCRDSQLRGKHWFAVRGAKAYDAPKLSRPKTYEFTWRGKPVPGGAELRWVGTQSIKTLIDGRLSLDVPGGGYYHFPLGFEADYYAQLRAEKREWRRDHQGNKALWWVQGSARNEAWDCEVYNYAAYLYAMSGRNAETVWVAREKLFGKVLQLDLLLIATAEPATQSQEVLDVSSASEPAAANTDNPDTTDIAPPPELPPYIAARRHKPPPRAKRSFATSW
jgi:phage terminase large subunit GpA-like protein